MSVEHAHIAAHNLRKVNSGRLRVSGSRQKLKTSTYAHCSMLASACSMTALFFLRAILAGSTVFRAYVSSRGGTSGGLGAFVERCPMDLSWPVRNCCTACLVRCTYISVSLHMTAREENVYLEHRIRCVQYDDRPLDQSRRWILCWDDGFRFSRFGRRYGEMGEIRQRRRGVGKFCKAISIPDTAGRYARC